MDADVIQCPTCGKKYKLSGTPPATFQCRNCGTVMDLSAYGAAPAAPPPPVPAPSAAAPPGRSAAPTRGRRPGRRTRTRGAAAGRGRRGGDDYDAGYDGEEDEGPGRYHRKKSNPALLWGSIGGCVVALLVLVILMSSRKKPPAPIEKAEEEVVVPIAVPVEPSPPPEKKKRVPKVAPGREDEKRPELREGDLYDIPIPEGKRKYSERQAELKIYPWPDYVTEAERAKIEESITSFEWGGRDMTDAEEYFVALDARTDDGKLKPGDQFKCVGRLIGEFKKIYDEFNGDIATPDCMSRLMVVDRILRRIDGMQQRDFQNREGIRARAPTSRRSR